MRLIGRGVIARLLLFGGLVPLLEEGSTIVLVDAVKVMQGSQDDRREAAGVEGEPDGRERQRHLDERTS